MTTTYSILEHAADSLLSRMLDEHVDISERYYTVGLNPIDGFDIVYTGKKIRHLITAHRAPTMFMVSKEVLEKISNHQLFPQFFKIGVKLTNLLATPLINTNRILTHLKDVYSIDDVVSVLGVFRFVGTQSRTTEMLNRKANRISIFNIPIGTSPKGLEVYTNRGLESRFASHPNHRVLLQLCDNWMNSILQSAS